MSHALMFNESLGLPKAISGSNLFSHPQLQPTHFAKANPLNDDSQHCGSLIGACSAMQALYTKIEKVALTDATVLVIGESGTGKELVARTLYEKSARNGQPYLAINCGAIPANLIESELFGYERGSYTGAHRMHKGYFERASGGTIFLDEITEMAPELQVKLLRVLETGTFSRVGGSQEIKVDVRVIAATNRLPEEAVREGKLREDLLYRLAVFPLTIPPLRERNTDILLLAEHFLQIIGNAQGTVKYFSIHAKNRLQAGDYSWPGNVRELNNLVQRAYILADDEVEMDCIPDDNGNVFAGDSSTTYLRISIGTPMVEAEKHLILAALNLYHWDKSKTAKALGMSLKTLYNRLHTYKASGMTFKAH